MPNNYYERLSEMNPGELADGLAIEQEFDAIARGFSKLPTPHRDGGGFEGPTKVGDPVEQGDAVNLSSLEKLNLPIYRKKITTENWNDITKPGIYDVSGASGDNRPAAYSYGILHVYSFNGVVSQIYYPDISDACVMAKRTCQNISMGVWQAWSLLLRSDPAVIKQACLVNSLGTGATNETVDAKLPASVVSNTRYVLTNPFGLNTPVICFAELLLGGIWADAKFGSDAGTGAHGYGASAMYAQGLGIILQTGRNGVSVDSAMSGGGHGSTGIISSAPCRIFVRKLEV
ncbi:hypothetical protein EHZ47_01790 [Aeromonas jandaei]|uniref:pyocin knob domain-containing protein n=1 Tax=Aeromonas jandaei TaxID=650 RepID=UPI000F53948B|nr:pyocin knob domain-containing protein [Aeromonas jandaei]RQM78849.1 hypothetical protein EHZ47_01790 [Aeromonas jandaei]